VPEDQETRQETERTEQTPEDGAVKTTRKRAPRAKPAVSNERATSLTAEAPAPQTAVMEAETPAKPARKRATKKSTDSGVADSATNAHEAESASNGATAPARKPRATRSPRSKAATQPTLPDSSQGASQAPEMSQEQSRAQAETQHQGSAESAGEPTGPAPATSRPAPRRFFGPYVTPAIPGEQAPTPADGADNGQLSPDAQNGRTDGRNTPGQAPGQTPGRWQQPFARREQGQQGQQPHQGTRGMPYTPGARTPQQRQHPQQQQPTNGSGGSSGAPYPPYGQYDAYGAPDQTQRPQGQQGRQPRGQTYPGGYGNPQGQRWNTGRPDQQRNQPGRRNQPTPDRRGPTPGRGQQQQGRPQRNAPGYPSANQRQPQTPARVVEVKGIFWAGGGQGLSQAELLDERTLQSIARFNPEDARRMGLRSGDIVSGTAEERGGRRTVVAMETVNDGAVENLQERRLFEQLTATFPTRRIRLEQGPRPVSVRIIDLFSPLGFGSRALIVAPPKTGKTTLIREAAEAVLQGYPDAVVMAVLVGERPEEVTDLRARIEPNGGHVYAASFDEQTERHAWLVQVAVERAKRVAESGKDAFMVLDSLTRLARAENLASRGQGRTLSGGIDAQALDTGRRAFGAARNLDEGGSITILATCLVETGSRQDDVVYEEFKGTGNMELHLSRELSQRRLFPSVDVIKSGTRREEMLLSPEELRAATLLRRRLADLPVTQATEQLLKVMERTPSNAVLIQALDTSNGR
jgi:transcription termination factor Rho